MASYKCMRCGKWYPTLKKAVDCCLGPDVPCHKCIAKNLCANKDPSAPAIDALNAKLAYADDIWEKRRCA